MNLVKDLDKALARFPKRPISEPKVLNEAYDYEKPVPFSRGARIELPGFSLILISGTASVNECGASIHPGDMEAQCWRTFRNIKALLAAEGADWKDIIRTTCYLRDMSRDYEVFNKVRAAFYEEQELEFVPASTAIQATICREDLLVEIEAIAVIPPDRQAPEAAE
jgi:enamine deaminase RidA (YjgF/YER057c/UK114 family)